MKLFRPRIQCGIRELLLLGSLRYLAYVIVDNGYLDWSCTVPPFGVSNDIDEIGWSKWLESMRKDVECTFRILKGRWRILKSGVRLHGVDAVDSVWLTSSQDAKVDP